MEKSPYTPIVFDLTDILAYLVKKALIIIVVCFLCGFIGVGINYLSSKSETAMEKHRQELDEYNTLLANTKNKLATLQSMRANTIELRENDPVLDLSSSEDVFVCKISFFINAEDDIIVSDSGLLIYPNQEQMKVYFDSLNLNQILDPNIKSNYLNRLVLFSSQGNNIVINAYNQNKDVASVWAEKVYQELQEFAVAEQGWIIINKTESVESYNGLYLVNLVNEYNDELARTDKSISETMKEVKALEASKPSNLHPLRFFVIGFVLGGGLTVMILLLGHISKNPVTKSFIAEKIIRKPFIGALFSEKKLFDRLARRVIGERIFLSESDKIDFIKNNIRNSFIDGQKKESVCILCSCDARHVEEQSKNLQSIFSEFGCRSELVVNASTNPNATNAVIRSDAILLLERQWESKWRAVHLSVELAERFDKQIIGFVLC